MKKQGFYCRMYGRDCFIETTQTRRTDRLAEDFIISVQFKLGWTNRFANDADVAYIKNAMRPAIMELKTIENGQFKGLQYITFDGGNFSYGCDACKNPFEVCVIV